MQRVHQAVIVGAGFGGMGAAIQLDRLGIRDFVIVERADDLGGTSARPGRAGGAAIHPSNRTGTSSN